MEKLGENKSNAPVAVILKVFYDEVLLKEDTILKWYSLDNQGIGRKDARNRANV
jgi:hypothetical protein